MVFVKRLALTAVATLAAFVALPASATTYTITPETGTNPFGSPKFVQSTHVTLNGNTWRASAGMFRLNLNDGAGNSFDLATFCIELDQHLQLPGTFSEQAFNPAQIDAVNALWSNAFTLVDNSQTAAAFQFSLWEITHDTGLDLSAGILTIDGRNQTDALAKSWLDNIDDSTWTANPLLTVTALVSPTSQDQLYARFEQTITTSAIPVPPSAVMLASSLGLVGLVATRRRSKRA
jgi:hypothetical protein